MSHKLKKFMATLLCIAMISTSFTVSSYGQTAESTWDGVTKTEPLFEDNHYQIANGAQLAWFRDYVNAGNVSANAQLIADIDLQSYPWAPMGDTKNKYKGTFDGNGYAIHNLFIDTDTNYIGLFGYLGAGATVTDFRIDGNISSNYVSNGGFAGGVAGYASGSSSQPVTVTKVHNNCNVTVKGSSYGSYAGGIIGYSGTNVVIDQCSNQANISGTQKAVGGIAGSAKKVSNCYNTGYVSGGVSVGGIAGLCSTDDIVNCYNQAYVKGTNYVGGITALTSRTVVTVRNCYNTGMIEAVAINGIKDDIAAAPLARTENCYYVNVAEDSYYGYGELLTSDDMRSAADELGEAFGVNVHSDYHFGYPILAWETEQCEFKALENKCITSVTIPEGVVTCASVEYNTTMDEHMFHVLGLGEEVILTVDQEQIRVPATWSCDTYQANEPGTYRLMPVYQLPEGAFCAADVKVMETAITVREKGAVAPLVSQVTLKDDTVNQVVVKYARTDLGLPEFVPAVVDGKQKQVYVQWKLPDGFSTTVPGTYEAKAYFPEEYRVADSVTMPVIQVTVKDQGYVGRLKFSAVKNDSYYEMIPAFDETVHEYTVYVPDSKSTFYCEASLDESVKSGTMDAIYTTTAGKETTKSITSGEIINLTQVVRAGNATNEANDNTVVIQAKDSNGTMQSYVIHVCRIRSLKSMKLYENGTELISEPAFSNQNFEYKVNVTDSAKTATIQVEATAMDSAISVSCDGEEGAVTDRGNGIYDISLGNQIVTTVTIHVAGQSQNSGQDYVVRFKKLRTAIVDFQVSPQAVVVVKDQYQERILEKEDGTFHLLEGENYTFSISKNGYCSVKESFVATNECKEIHLVAALENETIPVDMDAQWPSFGGNSNNNPVVSVKTPVQASDAALYWATRLGEGYGGQATGVPILVDGYMIVTAKDKIYKLDRFSGEIVAEGRMAGFSSFSIVPPTYAQGMIFVGLANGTIQAFHGETLESLWIFSDELKGQPNSPITYHDGYVYTGFWNSETKNANFVCVSVTDEDVEQTDEEKVSAWTYTQAGGFYWAGAYVCDDYVLVGTDDGEEGNTKQSSRILSLDPQTGKVIDSITGLNGDIRSSISYDEVTGRFYVTSKGGSFYEFAVEEDGTFQKDEQGVKGYALKELKLGGMSTSTPVVYNGRAYVGVSGVSQFTADSGHCVAVLDLESFTIAYKAETRGYPQTSGLLTTAYEAEDGYVYVYFVDNYIPGEVRYIKDKPGVTSVQEPYIENNGQDVKIYAPILFTPSQAQSQYAICTPVIDEFGTLYFKNDSAYLMAVGSNIDRIEVVKQPDKTIYQAGEHFDASGMAVHAVLQNGMRRDITDYVQIVAGENLTEDRREVSIRYSDVLYHDVNKSVSGESIHVNNVKLHPLYTSVGITVQKGNVPESPKPEETPSPTPSPTPTEPEEVVLGDLDGDQKVTLQDTQVALKAALKIVILDHTKIEAADVNKDRTVTLEDAQIILKVALKIIEMK